MRRLSGFLVVLSAVLIGVPQPPARADFAPVVISEVYPGGGNTSATYANDYVELFNRTAAVVSFTNWSVGYSSRTSSTWRSVPLKGSINPYHYFLVKMGTGGGGGAKKLPTADVTGSINVARTGGKVRLFDGSSTVDLLGFGPDVNAYEGKPLAAPSDNTHSLIRINAGCTDTNRNNLDFKILTPGPRNKASDGFQCGGGSGTNTAPVLSSIGAKSVTAGSKLAFTVSATDTDRNALSYSAAGLPSGATFTPSTRTFAWTPGQHQIGQWRVTFAVSDGKASDAETVTITVKSDPSTEPTSLSLQVTQEGNRKVASGTLSPPHPGSYVMVKHFRYEAGVWRRLGYERDVLDERSSYRATFLQAPPGTCLYTAHFSGDSDSPPAHAQVQEPC